jgi:fructose-1,6-bisphosphatase II
MSTFSIRNVGFDLVRATEAAALIAGRWMGLGRRDEADEAATVAMAQALKAMELTVHIVIGEEGKLGRHSPLVPSACRSVKAGARCRGRSIDGGRLLAQGLPGAISVAAIAPRGSIRSLYPAIHMDKIVGDRSGYALVSECLDAPAAWILALIARLKKKEIRDLVVFMLDRPRHAALIEEIRTAGARVMLRSDGDIAGALLAASVHSGVDLLMGVGGVPEGIIAACAIRSLGGAMLGRLAPQSDAERAACQAASLDTPQVFTADDLVPSDELFFAATASPMGRCSRACVIKANKPKRIRCYCCETHTRRQIHAEHLLEEGLLTTSISYKSTLYHLAGFSSRIRP